MPVYNKEDEGQNTSVGMKPITAGEIRPKLPTNPEPIESIKEFNIFDALAPIPKFKQLKGYNPYLIKGELDGYGSFATNFVDSRSPQETEAIKLQIDARKSVFGVESASEFTSLMTASAIGLVASVLLVFLLYRKFNR